MQPFLFFLWVWAGAQVVFAVFVYCISGQQVPILRVFRQQVKRPNPAEDPMHFFNACMAGWAAIVLCPYQLLFGAWYHAVLMALLFVPFYSLLFDRRVNRGLGNDPDYLGDGAGTDKALRKHLGRNAGRKKNRICLAAIVVLNLIGIAAALL